MTQLHILPKQSPLRVAHQSEILILRQEVAELRQALAASQQSDRSEINQNSEGSKFKVSISNSYTYVDVESILYVEAQGNYSTMHVRSDGNITKHLVAKTLKTVYASLPTNTFFRCHQSYVVNSKAIQSYSNNKGMHLLLTNNICIPVSRRKKKQVLEILEA